MCFLRIYLRIRCTNIFFWGLAVLYFRDSLLKNILIVDYSRKTCYDNLLNIIFLLFIPFINIIFMFSYVVLSKSFFCWSNCKKMIIKLIIKLIISNMKNIIGSYWILRIRIINYMISIYSMHNICHSKNVTNRKKFKLCTILIFSTHSIFIITNFLIIIVSFY